MSSLVMYSAAILGVIFVICSYVVLMMTISVDNIFSDGLIEGVNKSVEKAFIIIIANTLLVFAFDMFFLKHCREQLRAMFTFLFRRSNDEMWRYNRFESFESFALITDQTLALE
eukprot:UN09611